MKLRWSSQDLESWLQHGRKPILVLTGARQVGKTTLARSAIGKGFEYVAFDDPLIRADFEQVGAESLARRFPNAIFDEVQKAPHLIEVVKAVVDRADGDGDPVHRYLLLGSSQILLLEKVRESLAGRAQLRRLWPLAFAEISTEQGALDNPAPEPALARILRDENALEDLPESVGLHPRGEELLWIRDRLLERGGMPALWQGEIEPADLREELQTYVALYLERDLADLARLRDLQPFVRLQRLAAERTSQVLSFSELARDAGISVPTVKNYLRYLELSFQVVLIPPWFSNRSKRLIKAPRLHWTDVGIWRAVTRTWQDLSGELYESAIVSEILKVLDAFRLDDEPFHLRTYDQREVDLLLVRSHRAICVEIKKSEKVHPKDARHFRDLGDLLGERRLIGLVVYRGRKVVRLDEQIWAVPDALLFGPAS